VRKEKKKRNERDNRKSNGEPPRHHGTKKEGEKEVEGVFHLSLSKKKKGRKRKIEIAHEGAPEGTRKRKGGRCACRSFFLLGGGRGKEGGIKLRDLSS